MPTPDCDPGGLLTVDERDRLRDEETPAQTRNEILERVQDRLRDTLDDISLLYPLLRPQDIDEAFGSDDDGSMRAAVQNTLTLLVLGMLHDEDDLERRLGEALRHGTLSYGEDIEVDLTLRRGPSLTLAETKERVRQEGLTAENLARFEHHLYSSTASQEELAGLARLLGMEVDDEDFPEASQELPVHRPPLSTIVGIEVQDDQRSDSSHD